MTSLMRKSLFLYSQTVLGDDDFLRLLLGKNQCKFERLQLFKRVGDRVEKQRVLFYRDIHTHTSCGQDNTERPRIMGLLAPYPTLKAICLSTVRSQVIVPASHIHSGWAAASSAVMLTLPFRAVSQARQSAASIRYGASGCKETSFHAKKRCS